LAEPSAWPFFFKPITISSAIAVSLNVEILKIYCRAR
jgi:hypothetical protein